MFCKALKYARRVCKVCTTVDTVHETARKMHVTERCASQKGDKGGPREQTKTSAYATAPLWKGIVLIWKQNMKVEIYATVMEAGPAISKLVRVC